MKLKTVFWVTTLLHFGASAAAFMRSARIRSDGHTPFWQAVAEVLAFPLAYLPLFQHAEPVVLMLANSALWAGTLVLVCVAVSKLKKLQF